MEVMSRQNEEYLIAPRADPVVDGTPKSLLFSTRLFDFDFFSGELLNSKEVKIAKENVSSEGEA